MKMKDPMNASLPGNQADFSLYVIPKQFLRSGFNKSSVFFDGGYYVCWRAWSVLFLA